MRRTTVMGAWLLAAGALLAPARLSAQPTFEPSDPQLPLPLYHSHPESGGLFLAGKFVFYRQTNPIDSQVIATRGFFTLDEQILGPGTANRFFGSNAVALDAQQVSGPGSYQPGFTVEGGWRFADGSALTIGYMRLTEAKYTAAATLFPPGNLTGPLLVDTYLYSPVFNFPNQFSGPALDVGRPVDVPLVGLTSAPAPGATAGIWNGADIMTLSYVQRVQDIWLSYRVPITEQENYRCNGLVGPRNFWFWERFSWRTTDANQFGEASPQDVAIYSNVISNRLWGVFVGLEQECYLGHGFAVMADVKASAFVDIVKTRVKYERGDKYVGPANKRAKRDFYFVPEVEASLGLMWYPFEGIQMKIGYDVMAFFNTVSTESPVDFNYGALDPPFTNSVIRVLDGFHAGVALIF